MATSDIPSIFRTSNAPGDASPRGAHGLPSGFGMAEREIRRAAWALFLALFFLAGTLFAGETAPRKVVRVPCTEFNRLMVVDETGQAVSGYAHDFILTIADYAGWDVEFVPCTSFSAGVQQLLAGEADIYYDVSYTEERAKSILFPDEPMGFEHYYLYATADNTSIVPDDYATLDGRTVGATAGSITIDFLKSWGEKKGIRFNIVEFDDIADKEAALRAGEIDLDLELSMLAKSDFAAIEKVGACSYFLVARKGRPDLVDDINFAMEKVLDNDLYYFTRLQERYFSDTALNRKLTKAEKDWLEGHAALRVGYFDDYLPICTKDENGRPAGAVIDAIREIVRRLGLEDRLALEFVCFDNQSEGYKAVESGGIDLMVPAYISSSVRRDYRIAGGRVLMTLACDLVFRDGHDVGNTADLRIGVNRNNLMQHYYSRDSFPQAEIVFFDGIRACLDGVLDGTADGTFLNGLRTGALLKTQKYQPLDSMQGRQGFEFRMAFAEDNLGLLLLMNRGVAMLETDFIHKAAYSYAGRIHPPSLVDLLRKHILAAIAAGAVLAALLAGLVLSRIGNRKLAGINRALTEYAETIEEQGLKEADLRKELERKQAELEDALHMAQATYNEKTDVLTDLEDASELARLASFHYDFDTRKRTGSNLVRELWPVDATGRALLEEEFVYPDDIPVFKQNVAALLERKSETVQFSFRVGFWADNLRYYRMKLSLDPRKPNAVTGIVQDVTELAESMLKLKDTQALWDAAINAMPFKFAVKDVDNGFRYLLCNNAFADICICPPDEIAGKTEQELFGNDAYLDFANRMNQRALTLDANEIRVFDEDLPGADGGLHSIQTIMRLIRDSSGRRLLLAASSDVTEERNKREELRRAMTSLENASSMAHLASFRYGLKTRRRSGSSFLPSLWPNDENGEPLRFEDWVHPDDIPVFVRDLEEMQQTRKPGEVATFSFRTGKAPNLRYIRALTSLDLGNPDEPTVVGILQDVTELTESMLKLKDTQALWNAAINSIPIMFSVKDIDDGFRYLLCNKAFADIFNFSPDEIVGKTDHELFRDEATLGFADRINIPSTGTDGLREISGEVPDGNGNLRYVNSILRVFEDARGRHLLLAASKDFTDMHRLLQDRSTINKLLEDIIGENDFDLCIRRTLETVCKILGASRGFLNRHEDGTKAHCVAEYAEPAHPHASVKMLDRTFPRVRGLLDDAEDQRTFVCDDIGSFDWSLVQEEWHRAALDLDMRAVFISNIVNEGVVKGTVGFTFEGIEHAFTDNDISLLRATSHLIEVVLARKYAQALIMDALAHAQAADKAKSFFIASVSHEIRTPLNSVIGFAELLRDGGVSKARRKEYLDAISTSANALLMLINDVLDLSKLEANQMKIVTAFTDFNALCREVMLIFTFRAQENGNRLVADVPEDLPELEVDNIRIRQILINLFGNAVKFTKDGTITLHAAFTPDPGPADTGTLRFSVSDTGIGISEEDQKKLMEPFVQLSRMRGTNAMNNGTGLGLSISKRLAVCMNGELACTSHIGEGSTFSVTLNAVRYRAKTTLPAVLEPPKPQSIARDIKTIRILIVDDVPMNLHVAKALFGKIGFQNISTAESGKAALELLAKQPVDLILSDLWMPGMNGAAFSAAVKRNPELAHIPIVAQTADVETGGNFDMSHFDAVILKPLTSEKLSRMVKRILEDDPPRKPPGAAPLNLG